MDRLSFWLYRTLAVVLGGLPLPLVFRLGSGLGWYMYWAAGSYRRLAQANLEIAFPEQGASDRRRLARRHFATLGANSLSAVAIARIDPAKLSKMIPVEGLEHLQAVTATGRGAVMIVSHFGNWEACAQLSPLTFGCPAGTIYQRLNNSLMDAEVRDSRARLGLALFERKEGFQGAIKMLRAGGAVGVLVDQHAGDAGLWCPFFGRLASTSPLAATLALRTGAALIPTAVHTVGVAQWRMVLEPPLTVNTRSTEELTETINRALEQTIRGRPQDWFWVHNRWKLPRPRFLLSTYKRTSTTTPGAGSLQPFRIVVRASNWLGDAVMSVPAIRAMKYGRPDLHLSVLTPAKLSDFWRTIPEVDEVLPIPQERRSIWAVSRLLRAKKFEAAVVLPNSFRTGMEVWLAGIPRRVGYPGHVRAWLLNQVWREKRAKKQTSLPPRHQVNHYLQLAQFIGADASRVPPLRTTALRRTAGQSRVAICPGAEYGPAKQWLPERFRAVMEQLTTEAICTWVVVGVAKDAAIAAAVTHGFTGHVEDLVGKTSLAELIAVLQGCDALLTNDTGTMHLAALYGVPVVAVFGSTEPVLTGPLGANHVVLRHHVSCSPCFLRECPLDFRCMKSVSAEEASSALRRVLTVC